MSDNAVHFSILDMTWNEAIEAAAKDIEHQALGYASMGGETGSWNYGVADRFREAAQDIRKLKRVGK